MVFVVVADIKGHFIERAVIAIGFLRIIHHVVALNPARAERMQTYGKEKRKKQIAKRFGAEQQENRDIEAELHEPIE